MPPNSDLTTLTTQELLDLYSDDPIMQGLIQDEQRYEMEHSTTTGTTYQRTLTEAEQCAFESIDLKGTLTRDAAGRISGAVWFPAMTQVELTLIGMGGIGSWTGFLLNRLAVRQMICYDADTVEAHNTSGQLMGSSHIGSYKTDVFKNIIDYLGNPSVATSVYHEFVTAENFHPLKYTFCGLDNMAARRTIFEAWISSTPDNGNYWFIDGRLSATTAIVVIIPRNNPAAIAAYRERYLFTDEQAEETVCSFKQTSFMAAIIGGMMANALVNIVYNEGDNFPPVYIPFAIAYNSENFRTSTLNMP